jgi:hypothetical protein
MLISGYYTGPVRGSCQPAYHTSSNSWKLEPLCNLSCVNNEFFIASERTIYKLLAKIHTAPLLAHCTGHCNWTGNAADMEAKQIPRQVATKSCVVFEECSGLAEGPKTKAKIRGQTSVQVDRLS